MRTDACGHRAGRALNATVRRTLHQGAAAVLGAVRAGVRREATTAEAHVRAPGPVAGATGSRDGTLPRLRTIRVRPPSTGRRPDRSIRPRGAGRVPTRPPSGDTDANRPLAAEPRTRTPTRSRTPARIWTRNPTRTRTRTRTPTPTRTRPPRCPRWRPARRGGRLRRSARCPARTPPPRSPSRPSSPGGAPEALPGCPPPRGAPAPTGPPQAAAAPYPGSPYSPACSLVPHGGRGVPGPVVLRPDHAEPGPARPPGHRPPAPGGTAGVTAHPSGTGRPTSVGRFPPGEPGTPSLWCKSDTR